jgi:hypothetical protein
VIGEVVRKSVLDFLNFEIFDPSINTTLITLIPKTTSASSVSEFKPISLGNVLYKLIAKVLANKFKRVLPGLISPAQSAFVLGRLITDNVLVAYKALHSMVSRIKGRKCYMAVKLDMSKAYDRVEWSFLEAMMRTMGFVEKWIYLIMVCVRTVTYAVLVNGVPYGQIFPSRGLCQGDPLSPYLFLLVAEGFSSLIVRLNAEKTSIFFSKNTKPEFKGFIHSSAGITTSSCYEKYLGLPALVGRKKMKKFEGIQSKVRKKLEGWKERFLSQARKEILIKAMVQAIPTYSMSVFQLPKKLCSNLNSSPFWWGRIGDAKGVSWMSWGKMGVSKLKGGMGFQDLEIFNRALLAKKGWRLLKSPESLIGRVIKAKYYPNEDFMSTHLGNRPSFAGRSILNARGVVENGILWRVGNGETVKIWKDRWLPPPSNFLSYSLHQRLAEDARVCSLLDPTTGWWNIRLISENFSSEDVARILSVSPSPLLAPDTMIWRDTPHGQFTVRSAYYGEQQRRYHEVGESSYASKDVGFWKTLWGVKASGVVKIFPWEMGNELLPTMANLYKKKKT